MRIGSSVGTMKIGSTAVAAIKRGTDRVYDADVAAFQKASAASDVSGIMDLVDYLKTESLWDYARFFPMKSSQNAGTGSTVYGLGGLTSNNMTLVNSPTWGSDGVTFDGSATEYGAIDDCLSGGSVAVFWRGLVTSGNPYAFSHYSPLDDDRSWLLFKHTASVVRFVRSADGTSANAESWDGSAFSTNPVTYVATATPSGIGVWNGKSPESLTLVSGAPQTSTNNGAGKIGVMGYINTGSVPATLGAGRVAACGFIETALTTTQREAITDLINAL